MEGEEELELYELHYSDLMLLSSNKSTNNVSLLASPQELDRLEKLRRTVMETLGPSGPGLLSITGVPNASLLRRKLLPLARKLALLDHDHRKRILKEHNLGSDVPLKNPDRNVSSFAMQLKYIEALESTRGKPTGSVHPHFNSEPNHFDVDSVTKFQDDEFMNLADTFKELGYCMMELGLCLAQVCDKAIGSRELEQSLLESGTAKGRLIHYHSTVDNFVIKESGRRKGSAKKQANTKKYQECLLRSEQKELEGSNLVTNRTGVGTGGNHGKLWQQWHYDYGIFTVLTAPMFLVPSYLYEHVVAEQFSVLCDQECPCPSGHSYLQIFDPNKNNVYMVKTSPESFIIQVGESADILSRGKLRSTLHCVCRPEKLENLSRETFVVFLQPTWSKTFTISDYPTECCLLGGHLSNEDKGHAEHDLNEFTQEILKLVPPLSSRLKDGMTFAEFSRETTKQYYGGSGLQSNR